MNESAKLSTREYEISELIAWGATKKEISRQLFISERTVENHTRNIYEKTGCRKSNELSAWWFCTHFKIPFTLSPLARKSVACFLLATYIGGAFANPGINPRVRTEKVRTVTSRTGRRKENTFKFLAA